MMLPAAVEGQFVNNVLYLQGTLRFLVNHTALVNMFSPFLNFFQEIVSIGCSLSGSVTVIVMSPLTVYSSTTTPTIRLWDVQCTYMANGQWHGYAAVHQTNLHTDSSSYDCAAARTFCRAK